jgi:hypothetical protein
LRASTRAAVHHGTNSGYRSTSLISAYIRAGDSAIRADRLTSRMCANLNRAAHGYNRDVAKPDKKETRA